MSDTITEAELKAAMAKLWAIPDEELGLKLFGSKGQIEIWKELFGPNVAYHENLPIPPTEFPIAKT